MDEKEKDFLEGMTEKVEAEQPERVEPEKSEPEKGVEPAKPEPEASPAPEPKKEETVPLAALRAEREKRQAYERELAELRAKQQQEPAPNFYEAPDQYVQHLMTQAQQQATQRLYAALEAQARETYQDYDDVFAEVQAHAAENPAVVSQILNSPNPALAAYKFGKQLREMKALQDPAAYRASLKAEIMAELQKEAEAKESARRKAAESIPPDLANARSASTDQDVAGDPFKTLFSKE